MKKILSVILVFCLTFSLCAPSMAATGFKDVSEDNWAYKQIDYLSGQNVINGYENGEFRPDAQVNRAEYITMMAKIFGLKDTAEVNYIDIPEWANENIKKAKAQGFILDYPKDVNFNEKLTREEAVALLMRYLSISSSTEYTSITDISSVSSDFRDYVISAVSNGIIHGYLDGSFKPKNVLTRAEALTMLYNAAGKLYSYANSYANNAPSNNVTINGSIALEEFTLNGRVIVTEGVSYAMLTKCVVKGVVYDRGSDLILNSTNLSELNIYGDGEVTLTNTSSVARINVYGSASINIGEGCGVTDIYVYKSGSNTQIKGSGIVKKIWVYAEDVNSSILPIEYFIDTDCSAYFNGVYFTKGSGKTTVTGIAEAYVSGSTSKYGSDKITIDVIPQIDGVIYAAVWDRSERVYDTKDIYYFKNASAEVIAGVPAQLVISTQKSFDSYNVGLIIASGSGKDVAFYKPVYNSGKITLAKQAMTVGEPGYDKYSTPKWTLSAYNGSIYVEFDQMMYYNTRTTKTPLNELNSETLSKLFTVYTTGNPIGPYPARDTKEVNFTASCVKSFSNNSVTIRIDVEGGLAVGKIYYVGLSDNITNFYDIRPNNSSNTYSIM